MAVSNPIQYVCLQALVLCACAAMVASQQYDFGFGYGDSFLATNFGAPSLNTLTMAAARDPRGNTGNALLLPQWLSTDHPSGLNKLNQSSSAAHARRPHTGLTLRATSLLPQPSLSIRYITSSNWTSAPSQNTCIGFVAFRAQKLSKSIRADCRESRRHWYYLVQSKRLSSISTLPWYSACGSTLSCVHRKKK